MGGVGGGGGGGGGGVKKGRRITSLSVRTLVRFDVHGKMICDRTREKEISDKQSTLPFTRFLPYFISFSALFVLFFFFQPTFARKAVAADRALVRRLASVLLHVPTQLSRRGNRIRKKRGLGMFACKKQPRRRGSS